MAYAKLFKLLIRLGTAQITAVGVMSRSNCAVIWLAGHTVPAKETVHRRSPEAKSARALSSIIR